MTTPRTRRTPQQQATDILSKLLVTQRALVAKLQGDYVDAQIAAAKTERAIEALSTERLPEMQEAALAEEAKTRRAIEALRMDALRMDRLRGMEPEGACTCGYNSDTGLRLDVPCPWHPRFSTGMGGVTLTDVVVAEAEATCPECKHELPWHYEGCTVLAATLKVKE